MQRLTQILTRPFVWMTAVLLVAFWQVAFCRYTMQWDMTSQVFVWHRFISECFQAQIIPLWAPYSRFGYPIYADPQSGLFYPLTWLFTTFIRYTLYSNNLEYMLHVVLAAFGMKYLLRSVAVSTQTAALFGLVYAMSGPVVAHASHLMLIGSLCWMPFILGGYIRFLRGDRWLDLLRTALFIFLQLTGGYAGITITMIYVLGFILICHLITFYSFNVAIFRRLFFKHILLGLLTLMISAGYLYAVAQGQPYIDRGTGLTREYAGSVPFSPVSLITMLYPRASGDESIPFHTDLTMQDLYIGIIPLLLLLASVCFQRRRSTYVIFAGSIFFLLASMGSYTPLRGWMYDYMPLMRLFRHSGILRILSLIGFMVLAGRGFDAMTTIDDSSSKRMLHYIIGGAGALLSAAGVYMLFEVLYSPPEVLDKFYLFFLGQNLLIGICLLYIFSLIRKQAISKSTLTAMVSIVILLDMITSVQSVIHKTVISGQKVGIVQKRIDQYPFGFPIPENVSLTSYNQWNDSTIAPPVWQNAGFLRKQISYEGYNGFNLNNYNLLYDAPGAFQKLSSKKLIGSDSAAYIRITGFMPGRFIFDVNGNGAHKVTLAQMYFPGWSASIDGRTAPVAESIDHFVDCSVAAGSHHVEMTFAPSGAKGAFIYTVILVLMLLAVIAISYRRRPN